MQVKENIGNDIYLDLRICDNLELMGEISNNKVNLIYCDILYGTGRKFKDYQDLKSTRSEIEEHYIPRIKEMHRILKDNGTIYLQMDTRINHWIRIIMDEIFGYENFRNEISWCYDRWTNSSNDFIKQHDVILRYCKSKNFTFNKIKTNFSNKSKHKGNRFSKIENGKLNQEYITNERKKDIGDWWNISYLNSQSKERVDYDTQKPKSLIEIIVKASSNEGDLVADFYSGSFTTAEVCKDLKRNFIGCDINPNCLLKAKDRGLISNIM
jgi:site-specific DNA-methyltransferase (adenine-specific)